MIQPFTTERRIVLLILAIGLLVLIGLGLAAQVTIRAQAQQREWIVHTRNVIETIQHLIILLTEAETGQRGFLLTREAAYREPYEAAIQQIPSDLHALRRLTSDNPDQQRRLETMTGLVEHRLMLLQRTLALSPPEAISVIKKGEGRKTMDQIRSLAAEIQGTEQTFLESRTRKHDTLTSRVLILKTTASLVGVALLSIALLIIFRDARFQAQARVLAAQAQLLDEAPVLIRDAGGHTLMWSRGLERLYGWTKEAAVSQRSDELLATQRSLSHAALQRELDQKGMWTGEVMQRCRDESLRTVEVRAIQRADKDNKTVIVEVHTDLTDRFQAEAAVRESEAKFRQLADAMPQMVWMARPDGHVDYYNQRWYDFTGFSKNATGDESWTPILHPDDVKPTLDCWYEAVKTGTPYQREYRFRHHQTGTYVWYLGRALPIRNEAGDIIRWFGTCTDIEDLKRSQTVVRQLLREAEQREQTLRETQAQLLQTAKLASIGELATGVAHEINNPLNNIALFVANLDEYLQAGSINTEKARRQIKQTLNQVKKAATIVDHLRTFARQGDVQHDPISINEVISAAAFLFETPFQTNAIEFVIQLSDKEPRVLGNAIQLEQVLINLLANARDAVARSATKMVCIGSRVCDESVEVRVTDTGAGMAGDVQARIFDPFFTTKPVGQGTGLGLSISYGIISDHHGTITVHSVPGQGATFTVSLPRIAT